MVVRVLIVHVLIHCLRLCAQCKTGGRYTDRLVTHWYRPPEIMLGARLNPEP